MTSDPIHRPSTAAAPSGADQVAGEPDSPAGTLGGPAPPRPRTLLDRVGGVSGLRAVVTVFYQRVTGDPLLAPYFAGTDLSRLRAHQHWFLVAALGGPDYFTGRDLATVHGALGVTDPAFDAVLEHLSTTLEDLGTAADVIAEIAAVVETVRPAVVTRSPGRGEERS